MNLVQGRDGPPLRCACGAAMGGPAPSRWERLFLVGSHLMPLLLALVPALAYMILGDDGQRGKDVRIVLETNGTSCDAVCSALSALVIRCVCQNVTV